MAPDGEIELDHHVRCAKGRFEVAVALADDVGLGAPAGRKFARRTLGIEQRGQFLDLDIDEVGRVLGEIGVGGEHGRDRFSDIAHPLARQHRLQIGHQPGDVGLAGAEALAQPDRRQARDVSRSPHRDDARGRQCRGRLDRHDPAMRMGRAHDPHVQLLRENEVGDEAAFARQKRRILEPPYRPADDVRLQRCV